MEEQTAFGEHYDELTGEIQEIDENVEALKRSIVLLEDQLARFTTELANAEEQRERLQNELAMMDQSLTWTDDWTED